MKTVSSSHAKQNFGKLMEAIARSPVAIERHKLVKAIVCSPEVFSEKPSGSSWLNPTLEERRAARMAQDLVQKKRLIKHQRFAVALLTMAEHEQEKMIARARERVLRWRKEKLCSADYADRWDYLLNSSIGQMAHAMCSETDDWGAALRQNSPWHIFDLRDHEARQPV